MTKFRAAGVAAFVVALMIVEFALRSEPGSGSSRKRREVFHFKASAIDKVVSRLAPNLTMTGPITSPRLASSDMDSVPWTAGDDAMKNQILALVQERCSTQAHWSPGEGMRYYRVFGKSGVFAGRWSRVWLVAHCRNIFSADKYVWEPCCSGGDTVDVQLESTTAKVAVERVYELNHLGVMEAQFFVRKMGNYRMGIDILTTGATDTPLQLLNSITPQSSFPKESQARCLRAKYPRSMTFQAIRVELGNEVVPMARRCDDVPAFAGSTFDLRDRFRYGAWYKLSEKKCDGIHCDGTPWTSDRWIWASDLCRVQLYSTSALRSMFHQKRVFAWGSSALRFPILNMLRYRFDFLPTFDSRLQFTADQDALAVTYEPSMCDPLTSSVEECRANPANHRMGWETWNVSSDQKLARMRPHYVVVDRLSWLKDEDNETSYMESLKSWMTEYKATTSGAGAAKPLISIFAGSTAVENAGRFRPCKSEHLRQRRLNWVVEDFLTSLPPEDGENLFFINRLAITAPFHFGERYVRSFQGTPLYGWSMFACKHVGKAERNGGGVSGGERTKIGKSCVKPQTADDAFVAAMLNLMASSRQ